jgi:hypothetical protein
MDTETLVRLREEIQRRRRLYAHWLREAAELVDEEPPSVWSLDGDVLCWDVVLRETVEPDIDVEIGRDVLLVRARPARHPDRVVLSVLPVPGDYDPDRLRVHYEAERLEIRILRRGGRS